METGWKRTTAGYGWVSISFHWLMLLLIVATYAAMDLKSFYPKGSPAREALATWHFTLGLTVFCFVWLRLWARSTGPNPVIEPAMAAWQAMSAKAMHWVLYALMISLPLLGWLTISAKGINVSLFGTELPALIGKNDELAKWTKQIHEAIANAGYFLIGLHVSAALLHHYVKRDNTLKLMLPKR